MTSEKAENTVIEFTDNMKNKLKGIKRVTTDAKAKKDCDVLIEMIDFLRLLLVKEANDLSNPIRAELQGKDILPLN